MSDLPEPLVPAEVDLRDFSWMPIEVHRLRRSKAWLICKRKPELCFYMLNLWTAAWHDTPAASLEDDDDVLADLAMCEPSKWQKVREHVLRGWIKCSDGRLYHPVVADLARGAWAQVWSWGAPRRRRELANRADYAGICPGWATEHGKVRKLTTFHYFQEKIPALFFIHPTSPNTRQSVC